MIFLDVELGSYAHRYMGWQGGPALSWQISVSLGVGVISIKWVKAAKSRDRVASDSSLTPYWMEALKQTAQGIF